MGSDYYQTLKEMAVELEKNYSSDRNRPLLLHPPCDHRQTCSYWRQRQPLAGRKSRWGGITHYIVICDGVLCVPKGAVIPSEFVL